jgi:hypothetical protein
LLIEAAEADWKLVEPAIFGTLLERALDKRHVERLVTPTIMEPLREDWRDVQTAVQRLASDGKEEDACKLVRVFHSKLCEIRVLDPACESGNFLYVSLEMMKRVYRARHIRHELHRITVSGERGSQFSNAFVQQSRCNQ